MTLDEKIGQRFIVGFHGTKLSDEFIQLVKEYKIANVILFQRNMTDKEQLIALCQEIQNLVRQETGHGAFITIDQEGGVVTRLPGDMINCPGAMAVAATNNPENAFRVGVITAEELKSVGINFNLAPVLDTNNNPNNPVIGVRSYSDDPETVAVFGMQMIKGSAVGGVLSCAKHFPGHGDTAVDSHVGLPTVNKTKEELQKTELVPFIKAIQGHVPAIMTSHILFPELEEEAIPATMSRAVITKLLKNELGFKGLVVSDCMEMDAIKQYYGTAKGVVAAMKAGVDMVFVSHTAELAADAIKAVKEAVKNKEISLVELNETVDKILMWKKEFADHFSANRTSGITDSLTISNEIRRDSITRVSGMPMVLGEKPVFIGCLNYRASLASDALSDRFCFPEYMSNMLGGTAIITSVEPDESEINLILEKVKDASSIVYGTLNGHIKKGQLELGKKLAATSIPMTAVALRNPYDLCVYSEDITQYTLWEYSEQTFSLFIEILAGRLIAKGKLPVKLH